MGFNLEAVNRVEVLTLIDNYVDIAIADNSNMIKRGTPVKNNQYRGTILAEHGFSVQVTLHKGKQKKNLLFDFGLSDFAVGYNAETLEANLADIDILALSHGHPDHIGGLARLGENIGQNGLELVVHPAAFRQSRYMLKKSKDKVELPAFTREAVTEAGFKIVETARPLLLLSDTVLFLGEIPRKTSYEKGLPDCYYLEGKKVKSDYLEDDTSIVMHLEGKGLIVVSGCAHSGIINTVNHARETTGINEVYAIIGGFHLTGQHSQQAIEPTLQALKDISPEIIVPSHCTGYKATHLIEQEMPDKFLLNMSGTKITFDGLDQ